MLIYLFLYSTSFLGFQDESCVCEQFSCQMYRSSVAQYGNVKQILFFIHAESKMGVSFDLKNLRLKYTSQILQPIKSNRFHQILNGL